MEADKKQQLIDHYLTGKLSSEDLMILEAEAAQDDELLEELILAKSTIAGLKVQNKIQVKSELSAMYRKSEKWKLTKKRQTQKRLRLGIAASLFLAVTSVVFFYNINKNSNNPQQLFTDYYKPMPLSSVERGDKDETPEAFRYYSIEEYLLAAEAFEKIISKDPKNVKAKILLGNCYLNSGKEQSAIPIFEELKNEKDTIIAQYSHWYLSLAYLKLSQIEQCKESLSLVESSNMVHAKEASELLKELR